MAPSREVRSSSLRIAIAYNRRRSDEEEQAELLTEEYIELVRDAIAELGHDVFPVEVSGRPEDVIDRLIEARPGLIFNLAEGTSMPRREAHYPAIYEVMELAYTGGGPALLKVGLDKRLMEKVFDVNGVRVPRGALVTREHRELPDWLEYPIFIKPNYEGSSMGIHKDSLAETPEDANAFIDELLSEFPQGVDVEEFIPGRELTVPMLEEYPGHVLEIVEYSFEGDEHNVFDYEKKSDPDKDEYLHTKCPAELEPVERQEVLALADRAFTVVRAPDFARADIRLHENGTPYLLEVNPLPGLRKVSPMTTAAEAKGIGYIDMIDLILRSARKRYDI